MYPLPSSLILKNSEECIEIGREIAHRAQVNDIIALCGPLGVGKTTLTKGIIGGLGIIDSALSQTFMIIKEYQNALPIYHIDLYRLHENELDELGLHDLFSARQITIIEWAEKARDYLPTKETIWIYLSIMEDSARKITICLP